MVVGLSVFIGLSIKVYRDAPLISERVLSRSGDTLFTGKDIRTGQQVCLQYGLLETSSIWTHGASSGPDFSVGYVHALATDVREMLIRECFARPCHDLAVASQGVISEKCGTFGNAAKRSQSARSSRPPRWKRLDIQRQLLGWTLHCSPWRPGDVPSAGFVGKAQKRARAGREATAFHGAVKNSQAAGYPDCALA